MASWELPPGWRWGAEGISGDFRHYQEVIDGLGRALALVTAPDPAHQRWLHAEAIGLAHRSHPSIPATYHYWTNQRDRGPGYLRRWVSGESVGARFEGQGAADVPYVLRLLRDAGSALAYLHTTGAVHGSLSADALWTTPTGGFWMLEWQWATPQEDIPAGLHPPFDQAPLPPEWADGLWRPTPESDQWQLAATCFALLTGEAAPIRDTPPVKLLRPETPESVAVAIDRALLSDPAHRFESMGAMIRAAERGYGGGERAVTLTDRNKGVPDTEDANERQVRDAVGYDYEILSKLGSGGFGTVWRARDLALEREIALKVLHPHIARDSEAVNAFWQEARLAAQLAHPAIVPIFDWDGRNGLSWYTMELAEGGSVAQLVARRGARALEDIAPHVDLILDGLSAAHSIGVIHRDLKPENVLIDRYHRARDGRGSGPLRGNARIRRSGATAWGAAGVQCRLLLRRRGGCVRAHGTAALSGRRRSKHSRAAAGRANRSIGSGDADRGVAAEGPLAAARGAVRRRYRDASGLAGRGCRCSQARKGPQMVAKAGADRTSITREFLLERLWRQTCNPPRAQRLMFGGIVIQLFTVRQL